jgi:hypothetical protein
LHGAVITETADLAFSGSGSGLSLGMFDTSLGVLTSVTLRWTLNASITSASLTNNTSDTATVTSLDIDNQATLYSAVGLYHVDQHSTVALPDGGAVLNPGDSYSYSGAGINLEQITSESYINPGDNYFEFFKGSGGMSMFLMSALSGVPSGSDGSGWQTILTADRTAHLTATYTYTPGSGGGIAPVPEPSAMILGCGGLFFMVGMAFKKRRGSQSKLPSEV